MDDEVASRLASLSEGVLVASSRRWNPALHPRARNGQFIKKGGWIRALFTMPDGRKNALNGKVLGFSDNPADARNPLVQVMTKQGEMTVPVFDVQKAAPPKGSLSKKVADVSHVFGRENSFDKIEMTYEQKISARTKQLNRINTAAADLDPSNPSIRAQQLNKILSGVRGTPMSTVELENKRGKSRDEWDAQRRAQHEQLWERFIARVDEAGVPKERKALALGGLPGAGKSWSLQPGETAAELGVTGWDTTGDAPDGVTHVVLNPDTLKELMIEAGMLPDGISPNIKPREQVTFIHAESNFLVSLFFQRLAGDGYNVVYDTTMANVPHVKKNLGPMRENGYSFQGLFVDIDYTESRVSATKRYAEEFADPLGGRFVPAEAGAAPSSRGFRSANRDVFQDMTEWFDEWLVIDNSGVSAGQPRKEIVDRGTGLDPKVTAYRKAAEARRAKAAAEFKERALKAPTKAVPGVPAPKRQPGVFQFTGDEPAGSMADFLRDRGMQSSAAPDAVPWPVLVWGLRSRRLDPPDALEMLRSDKVFVADSPEISPDDTWDDEIDAYAAASTLPHELSLLGADDYLDDFATEVERLRAAGQTMSRYIEALDA